MTSSCPTPATRDEVEEPDDHERVLGISTATQVLGQWAAFVHASGSELQGRALPWAWERRCLSPTAGGNGQRARLPLDIHAADAPSGDDLVHDLEATLGLRNSAVGCTIAALSATMREARLCTAAVTELCRPLALFGEAQGPEPEGPSIQTPVALLVEFAEALPALVRIKRLLERVAAVSGHLLLQLVGVHSAAEGVAGVARTSQGNLERLMPLGRGPLRPALEVLGELLAVPVVVDGLAIENTQLRSAYESYCRVVTKACGAPSGVGTAVSGALALPELTPEAATALAEELREVDVIARGDAFQVCLDRAMEALGSVGPSSSAAANLREQLEAYCRARLEETEAAGPVAGARLELPVQSLVPWVCTFVLAATWRARKGDARLVKDLWKSQQRAPVVVLHGRIVWCAVEFLQTYLPKLVADAGLTKELADLPAIRRKQAERLDDGSFDQQMQKQRSAVHVWLAALGAESAAFGGSVSGGHAPDSAGSVKHARSLKRAGVVLFRGLELALSIRAALEEYLMLHIIEAVPVPRGCLGSVALGLRLLRSVETAPTSPRWAEISVLSQRHLALQLHREIDDARAKLKGKPADLQSAEALRIALRALYRAIGGTPREHLDWHFDVGVLASCAGATSSGRWREMRIMSRWPEQLARLCDTSWCYWVRNLFPELIADACWEKKGAKSLPLLCSVFAAPLAKLVLAETPLGRAYLQELRSSLGLRVAEPLARAVEEDIRLDAHATMNGSVHAPSKNVVAEVRELLAMPPLSLAPGLVVDLRDEVERRLSKTFYDLGALAPQDEEAYVRMRAIARERYGLSLLDGGLPGGTVDCGLDVIEIMWSIHLFAAQYSYSMHQQLFTQAANKGDVKIRAITVEHLTASIRRHGMGIINTTVNYACGFLKRKLELVVGFFADESVRSRLLADQRWMQEQRSVGGTYTWGRAVETAKRVRSLGSKDGVTYLDKLRRTVAQIGNALGYLRMVRSAGMRCVAGSLPYIEPTSQRAQAIDRDEGAASATKGAATGRAPEAPGGAEGRREGGAGAGDADAGVDADSAARDGDGATDWQRASLVELAKAALCPPLVVEAAETSDEAASSVRRCFEVGTDYLNLLAQVFGRVLGTAADRVTPGPALFYLLVPALALSFLDALLVGRETLSKRGVAFGSSSMQINAMCFDDGFAVGLAFILRVLGQEPDFHALNWFDAQVPHGVDGPAAAAAAAAALPAGPPDQKSSGSRRAVLERELGRLAAALEAASSLFGTPGVGRSDGAIVS